MRDIDEIRREIAAGTYLTDERMDRACDALAEEIRGQRGPDGCATRAQRDSGLIVALCIIITIAAAAAWVLL